MIVMHQVGALWEIGADDGSDAIGEQGIIAASSRERPLGHTDNDDLIELEAEPEGDGADEHPVAERAVAAQVVGELKLQGPTERPGGGLGVDAIEVAEAVDRRVDSLGCGLFFERPVGPQGLAAKVRANERTAPGGEPGPCSAHTAGVECRIEVGDEVGECAGRLGVATVTGGLPFEFGVAFGIDGIGLEIVGQAGQSVLPLFESCDDAGRSGGALPRRDWCGAVVGASDRCTGEPGGDVVTGEVVVRERKEGEQ